MLLMQARENRVVLDEKQLLFIAGGQDNVFDEDVDEPPVQDITLSVDNVFQPDECDAFDFNVDEAPTTQTMFMVNLSSADPIYDKAGPSYDSDILFEAFTKEIKEIFEELEAEVDQNVVNRKYDEIEWKNLLIANDNLIADCLENSELTVSRFTEMHDPYTIVQARCLELKAELSKLNDKIQKDDHNELEARVERPLDRSLASAYRYTKLSQELLEYAIGTCPKDFNKHDKNHATTPLNRKKNLSRLKNFVKKFIETIGFGNDHFGAIMGYGDYVISDRVISRVPVILAGTPSSSTIDQEAPSPSHSPSSSELQPPISHQGVAAGSTIFEDNPFVTFDNDPFVNVFTLEPSSKALSSKDISSA
nr:integrase, catalytic region, zinc finger, CCHC-type, peptidase aspartic, catalytic [Tanacetum cinerariifolium]